MQSRIFCRLCRLTYVHARRRLKYFFSIGNTRVVYKFCSFLFFHFFYFSFIFFFFLSECNSLQRDWMESFKGQKPDNKMTILFCWRVQVSYSIKFEPFWKSHSYNCKSNLNLDEIKVVVFKGEQKKNKSKHFSQNLFFFLFSCDVVFS